MRTADGDSPHGSEAIAADGYRVYHGCQAMAFLTLETDAPDLAGWLWVAAACLLALELIRYVVRGTYPAGRSARLAISSAVLSTITLSAIVWEPALGASAHPYACLTLGVLAALWLRRSYQETNGALSPLLRWSLLGTRAVAIAIVLAVVIGPVLQWTHVVREQAAIGIALDNSRSMTIQDAVPAGAPIQPAFVSRMEAVKASLSHAQRSLDQLGETTDVQWFVFDRESKAGGASDLNGQGSSTALAESVRQATSALEQTRRKVAGVILISDGRDNASLLARPEEACADLAALGIPLYAVGVGSDQPVGEVRGLQGRRMEAPLQVAVENRLPVVGEFLATGLVGDQIEVSLLIDGTKVESKTLEPSQPRESLRAEFSRTMTEGGLHRVTLQAQTTSQVTEPAELSQFVRVSEDSVPVLYVDRPRYERAAIVRALAATREVRLTRLDADDLTRKPARRDNDKTAPEWDRHRVILIGDVAPQVLTPALQTDLRDAVLAGKRGLAFVGGVRTMSGELAGGPLAEVIPVDGAASGELPGPVPFELTDAGRMHPICRLAPEAAASVELWSRLPPFAGCTRLTRPAPSAEVLLQTADNAPLMVVRQSGKGRSAVLAFDSTWQWSFANDQGRDMQHRFWRQLVLWLADRKPNVWATTDRPRYDLARLRPGGESVLLRAGVIDPNTGQEPSGVRVVASLIAPGATPRPVQLVQAKDGLEAKLTPDKVGEFHVEVAAFSGDQLLDKTQTAFVVASIDQELAEPLADLETLRRMAARTETVGGRYVPLTELPGLLDRIRASAATAEFKRTERLRLVGEHPWIWFSVLLIVLIAEWVVRRRVGLV